MKTERVPFGVFVLGLGVFCLGTSEFMIAGLLPEIAADLSVTIPQAGLLITGFAIGMVVGAPTMALATLRLPRRATLVGAAAVFAVTHLLSGLTDSYPLLMVGRVVSAVACGAFWSVGAVIAVRMAPAGATAKALSVMVGGLTLANILGVPLGTWLGQQGGWRVAFFAIAALSILVILGVTFLIPAQEATPAGGPRFGALLARELRAFTTRRMWLALATTAMFQAAVFAAFSYFTPLLTTVAGVPSHLIPVVLTGFGVGSFIGITIGSRVADRSLFGNIFVSLAAMTVVLMGLAIVAESLVGAVVGVFLVGLTGFSIAGALNARVFAVAGDAPTLAAATNTSAFNVGNALGPWLGGLVITAGWGYPATVWLAAGLGIVALGIAFLSWSHEKTLTAPVPVLATTEYHSTATSSASLSGRQPRQEG